MPRFFSKMRYKLASENRAFKYLRYAIGEIFLVVIGILIALEVNNWNEQRTSKHAVKTYLEALSLETQYNIRTLQFTLDIYKQNIAADRHYYNALNQRNPGSVPDSTIYNATKYINVNYGPRKLTLAAYNDLINSGLLRTIKDKQFRRRIFQLQSLSDSYEQLLDASNDEYKKSLDPYFNQNADYSAIADSIDNFKVKPLHFRIDRSRFVNNRVFSNYLINYLAWQDYSSNQIENLKSYLEKLIVAIKKHQK
jgi:hypothetical protein